MQESWISILPPLVSVVAALLSRHVIFSLFAGVWVGAIASVWTTQNEFSPWAAFMRTMDTHLPGALESASHIRILLFSLLLGGMIGIIRASGGAESFASKLTRFAHSRKRGQWVIWGAGLGVFIDDYANALLVGSSMRSLADRLRISREKLAFLVDATSAPVASVALLSSWIGVELSYIGEQYQALGIETDAYTAFLQTLPYRFYPWLMLAFGALLIWTGKDFGPMKHAEQRAQRNSELLIESSHEDSTQRNPNQRNLLQDHRWVYGLTPIIVVLIATFLGMYFDGKANLPETEQATLAQILSHASSSKALLMATSLGGLCAFILVVCGKSLTFTDAFASWLSGTRELLEPCMILVLAWSLSAQCQSLGTAQWLVSLLHDSLPVALLPAAVFLLSGAISFATGTSWGTMAIVFPLAVPLAFSMNPQDTALLLSTIASILSGAVWGDHCSPISDTTLLSSLASGCDPAAHVQTQMPYALFVGGVSLFFGDIAVGLKLYSPWVALALCVVIMGLFLRWGVAKEKLEAKRFFPR